MSNETDEKVWVLVETVSTFRMRYMIEAPIDHPEYALDDVTMQTAKEFSQQWIGEQIVSHRVMNSRMTALQLCDEDNHYCSKWTEEQKMNAFFTREGETREI
jgi:hypothetical protein